MGHLRHGSNWVMAFSKFNIRTQTQTSNCDLENENTTIIFQCLVVFIREQDSGAPGWGSRWSVQLQLRS